MEEKILLFTEKQGWPRVVDEKSQREREREREWYFLIKTICFLSVG